MSETKFTAGPWEIEFGQAHLVPGFPICVGHGVAYLPLHPEGQHTANAHLIAAAPEMYEAHEENARVLSLLLADLRGRVDESKISGLHACIDRSNAICAKARGENG